MKKTLFILICNIVALTSFGQTEEERRAIIAAKNKIQSDSLSLHSRSMRVQEQKKHNEQLVEALENAYKTIGLHEQLATTLRTDLEVCSDSLSVAQTQLDTSNKEVEDQTGKKKAWRKVAIGSILVVAVETLILFVL
jgi:hypothetical protein